MIIPHINNNRGKYYSYLLLYNKIIILYYSCGFYKNG